MTPGIQPQSVSKKMIKKEPQPLSMTAKGGKTIAKSTLKKLIILLLPSTNKTFNYLICFKYSFF
jgi:hypothetical protein